MPPLTLLPGTRLGPYEILSVLGVGGMGEVYRARDSKLNRDVAIKVLLPAVSKDPDRLARFSREAHVLASMNHPNIAAIYGLEDVGDVRALVLELVEGPTLADRIAHGAVPLDEVLSIARQIAEALEAAHEHGIIHRDLKPANIKVRPDGTVKVLDFGLAKALDPARSSSVDAMNSPTLTAATVHGVILGTAAYMSPEQARGKTVDKRADIWAFGVVLFEMLSGRPLYAGDTVTDILANIVSREPDWNALSARTPAAVRRLLERCLDKDPQHRLRDIGEARILLERTGTASDAEPGASQKAAARSLRTWAVALATAVVVGVVGFAVAWMLRGRDRGLVDLVRLAATLPPGVTIPVDTYNVLAISRDGSRVAVIGASGGVNRIYVRTLRDFEAHPLVGTEGAAEPFFSPDGAWIGFFANGSLNKTPAEGGTIATIAAAEDVRGAVWTQADTIVFPESGISPLSSVPASGGQPRAVTTLEPQNHERTHRLPSALPDGKTVLFNVGSWSSIEDYDDATIEAVRLDNGGRKLLLRGGRMPTYTAIGDLLYVRGTVLYAVALDSRRLEIRGRPRPILDGVLGDPTTGAAFFAVSDSGTLAYIPGTPPGSERRLAWVDRDGKTTPIDLPRALYTDLRSSPDGTRVAFSILVPGSNTRDVWIGNPARGTSTRLTSQGANWTPIWSPDGRRVFSVSYDGVNHRSRVEVRAADGSGELAQIGAVHGLAFLGGITPDGATLFLSASPASDKPFHIYRLGSGGGGNASLIEVPVAAGSNPWHLALSPNGRWLAYSTEDGGREQVFVQSAESGRGRVQVSTDGGTEPHWAPDGREIYFVRNNDLFAVSFDAASAAGRGRPRRVFGDVLQGSVLSRQTYDVNPISGRFLMLRATTDRPPTPEVRLILNWFTDIRRNAR